MGWLVGWHSRKELIADRIKTEEFNGRRWTTLAHCCRGNVLYKVQQLTDIETGEEVTRLIGIDLLQRFSAADNPQGAWGYKDLDEGMGPNAVTCPPKYFDLCPIEVTSKDMSDTWIERAKAWRADCIKRHELAYGKLDLPVNPGDELVIRDDQRPAHFNGHDMRRFIFRGRYKRRGVLIDGQLPSGRWWTNMLIRFDTFKWLYERSTAST